MNELTVKRMSMLNEMFDNAIANDENNANELIQGTYATLNVVSHKPSDIGSMNREELDLITVGLDKADTLAELTAVQIARIRCRYYKELSENKSVMIGNKKFTTITALSEYFGISKQRGSDYTHIATLSILYNDDYASWSLGRFTTAYDVINTGKVEFKGKYTENDIKPEMTIGDMCELIKSKKKQEGAIETTANDVNGTDNGTDNADNNADNNGNKGITYNNNTDKWIFKNVSYTELKAFIYEQLDKMSDKARDNVVVNGTLTIKIATNKK